MQQLVTATLSELEARIERGLQTFVEVGSALLKIRDSRLYRERGYERFEDYCRERWGFSRPRAYQLIQAAEMSTIVDVENESQARELAPLRDDPEAMRQAWQTANEATGGKPTATAVREAVQSITTPEPERKAEDPAYEPQPAPATDWAEVVETPANLMSSPEPEQILRHDAALRMSETNEWYTPPAYIDAARQVLGGIDLDPASCAEANAVVQATTYYDRHTDGLTQTWQGRVWLNPPYGGLNARFSARLVEEYQAGNVEAAVLLVNAHCTDTAWFQPLWDYTLCFTDHRINFRSPDSRASGSTHGSVFVYLGANPGRFAEVFSQFGAIVRRWFP